ncbi:MAG: DUF1826 domain-containing protein [Alkalimonas sp.]|nr:DUF1826 domain-containing protein [Alkalimonas sp.]
MISYSSFKPESISPAIGTARQCLSPQPEILTSIFEPDVNLAVWQRQLAEPLISYSRLLLNELPLPLQQMLPIRDINTDLTSLLPGGPGQAHFIADVVQIAEMFACLMDCQQVGLRLRVLNQPMCPKFHTDHLLCRLVSSYAGPATEWHAGPVQAKEPTQQLQCGDIALLKGSGWEDSACYAISHRSPASPEPRLLLTLDPVF